MNKPLLVVVTGSPASGKTTLARILSGKINCPLLSRDELKEGYLNTLHIDHNPSDASADLHVYHTFFEAINLLVAKGISMIVEAAFQDKLWTPNLLTLSDKADIRIIICQTNPDLIKVRFTDRLSNNPGREKFHGDQSLLLAKDRFASLTENYHPVSINAPTLEVDTTENYNPDLDDIIRFIRQKAIT